MLLTIFYNKLCIKSRFLRAVARNMDWQLRELDIEHRDTIIEYNLLMKNVALPPVEADQIPCPAIYTQEVYSHEMYPIIEYMSERNPATLMPIEIPHRLVVWTCIHRMLRDMNECWDEYLQTQNPERLLTALDNQRPMLFNCINSQAAFRGPDNDPSLLDLLYFVIVSELAVHKTTNDTKIKGWHASLMAKPALAELAKESGSGIKHFA